MSSSASVKLRYEMCLQVWGNAKPKDTVPTVEKTPQDRILEIEARLKELED